MSNEIPQDVLDYGVYCPLCNSWYNGDPDVGYVFWKVGETCGNTSMYGPHPDKCSPTHPCPGLLVCARGRQRRKRPDDGEDYNPEVAS